ncbi:MAG: alkaline phosphatase family protein [Candidatus Omnitrophota bacterium]
MMKKKVLVIGLDGATLDIIKPLADNGRLPNFSRLMREGSYGVLKSTIPPVTPCAWTSFATGKDPSKHGLYDFTLYEGDPEKQTNVNRTFAKAKSLWRILTENGKRSIVIDVPFTYPPEEINGCIIAREFSPSGKNCAYPRSLYGYLKKNGFIKKAPAELNEVHRHDNARNRVDRKVISKIEAKRISAEKIAKNFRELTEGVDRNIRLCRQLMAEEEWDLFVAVFMSADHAGHSFWGDKGKVHKVYEKLDEAVGMLFRFAGPETLKLIISDHGFTSVPYAFNINEWLCSKGFLDKKIDIPYQDTRKRLRKVLKKIRDDAAERRRGRKYKFKKFKFILNTDYSKSRAYLQSFTSYGVRINLKKRDDRGIVGADEYRPMREYLIKELSRLNHPLTGKKLFEHVLKKEEVYAPGPFGTDPAPDIFLLTEGMETALDGKFDRDARVFKKTVKGYGFHHIDGILFVEGEDIKNGRISNAGITDIAPTILHILGIPIPADMDGRVLKEIFSDSSEARKKDVRHGAAATARQRREIYPDSDDEDVRAKLAALGYL